MNQKQLMELARNIAVEHGLDPDIFLRQIGVESNWDAKATSPKGAQGLGQIMPGTQKELGITDPFDPEQSLRGAAGYMARQLADSKGNYRQALAKYNAGPKGASGDVWPAETHDYVGKILSPEENMRYASEQFGPMDIHKFRKAFPMYKDVSDKDVAERLHKQFAPDMEIGQFRQKFGVGPGVWESIKALPGAVSEGVRTPLAGALETGPVLTRAQEHATVKQGSGIPEGASPVAMPSGQVLSKVPTPFMAAQLPGVRSPWEVSEAQRATQVPLEEHPLYQLGNWMRREPTAASDVVSGLPYQVAKNIGQLPTQIGLAVTHPGLGLAGTVGMEVAEMYRRGKMQGVDEETSAKAAMEAAPLGLLDYAGLMVPTKMLGTLFRKTTGVAGNRILQIIDKYPKASITTAGTLGEIATEVVQTYGEDEIAKKHYNELVDTYESMKEAGTVAGAASLITYGLLSAIGVKMRGGGQKTQAGTEVKTPTPPVDPEVEAIYQEHLKRVDKPYQTPRPEWADAEQIYQDRFGPKQPQAPFVEQTIQRQGPVSFGEMAAAPTPPDLGIQSVARQAPELSQLIAERGTRPAMQPSPIYTPPMQAQPVEAGIGGPLMTPGPPQAVAPSPPRLDIKPVEQGLPELSRRIIQRQAEKATLEMRVAEKVYRSKSGLGSAIEYYKNKHGIQLEPQVQEDGTYRLRPIREVRAEKPVVTMPEVLEEKKAPEIVETTEGPKRQKEEIDLPMVAAQRAELEAMKARSTQDAAKTGKVLQTQEKEAIIKEAGPQIPKGRSVEEVRARRIQQSKLISEAQRKTFKDYGEASDWLTQHEGLVEGRIDSSGKRLVDLKPVEVESVEAYEQGPDIEFHSFDPFQMLKPMWFSQMNLAVQNDIPNWPKMLSAKEVEGRLEKLAQLGKFKREELNDTIRMSGLGQWLQSWGDQKIPRDAVGTWMDENQIRVEEVVYGGPEEPFNWDTQPLDDLNRELTPAKYPNQYQLPGGSNYVELVLTSPQSQEMSEDSMHFAEGQGTRQIGWIRGKEFTDASGEKVFLIEEVQSKRHQEGRKKGYGNTVENRLKLQDDYNRLTNSYANQQISRAEFLFREAQLLEQMRSLGSVPDAPFRESAMRLMARRVIRWAAERGIKKIAWATGEQQAERWSLRQVADQFTYDGQELVGYREGGDPSYRREHRPEELPELLGPELAQDLINSGAVVVPEGVELYKSGWPKKIYGFEGGYHKGVWGVALKEAARPFKVREITVKSPRIADMSLEELNAAYDAGMLTDEEYSGGINSTLTTAQPDLKNFSIQPGIEISEELAQSFAKEPMKLYSFNPFYMLKGNSNTLKTDITAGLKDDKITTKWVNDTFGWLDKYAVQPWWGAKDNPRLEPIVRAAHNIGHRFNEWFSQSVEILKDVGKMSKAEQGLMWETMWKIEGKKLPDMNDSAIVLVQDNIASLNPTWYADYHAWARRQVPDNVADVMVEVRRSLDQDHVNRWNLAVRSETSNAVLEQLKANTFGIPNYLPHARYGDYVIEGYNEQGEKVVDSAVDLTMLLENIPGFKDNINKNRFEKQIAPKVIAKLKQDPLIQNAGVVDWQLTKRVSKDTNMVENNAMLYLALDNVLNNAADSLEQSGKKELADSFRGALPRAVADELKKRSDWGHTAKRKGLLGYEKEKMAKVLYDYKMGQYAGLAKMVGAKELTELSKNLDRRMEHEYDFATRYMRDILEPSSGIEQLVTTFRGLAGLKYLGGSIKTALINLTTFWLQGGSRLAMDVGPSADRFIASATKKVTQRLMGSQLPDWQDRLVRELIKDGTIQNQLIAEVRAQSGRMPGFDSWLGRSFDIAMAPISVTERFSRTITAIAAADAAVQGKVENQKHGIQKGKMNPAENEQDYERIKSYAEEVVLDSHGLYGKANRPSFARTGRLGKLVSASYTFRNFQQNLIHLYSSMIRKGLTGNKNATYAFARAIMGTVAITGVSAGIPLAATIRAICRSMFKEDPLLKLREWTPEEYKTLMTYGLSGALGQVGVGASYNMESPESFEDLFGIPVAMVKDLGQAKKAWTVGDNWKLFEALVPVKLLRNMSQAIRLMDEGQTAMSGQPINIEGGTEPMTISLDEAILKSFGFQPLRLQEAWDVTEIAESFESIASKKQTQLADRFKVAMNKNNPEEMDRVLAELEDWNTYWGERGREEFLIDIRDSLETRMVPRRPKRRSAQATLELVEEIMR